MRLQRFFDERVRAGEDMVLVTVFETRGSTYSKAGGQMLIDGSGNFAGMLSGGCLEGDLVERARSVMKSGDTDTVTYDLAADDDLWGLGVGCDGTMRMLLQPLMPGQEYQPFTAIAEAMNGTEAAVLAVVIAAESPEVRAGASLVAARGDIQCFGMSEALLSSVTLAIDQCGPAELRELDSPAGRCSVFFSRVLPPPSLLVLGAGLDSEPVVRIATELGWRITVCDRRPSHVDSRSFAAGVHALSCPANELSGHVVLDTFDMAIVMSHHLASDRAYLRQLAATSIGYIGLLGPAGRRERLLSESTDLAKDLGARLHGPAGLDLGGRGPGPIALAIVAEMQQFLRERV